MKHFITASLLLLSGAATLHAADLSEPVLVGAGNVSSAAREFATSLSPDGQTLYFNRASASGAWHIWMSRQTDGVWAEPRVAPFSDDRYSDVDPFVSRAGDRLYFSSDRPLPGSNTEAPTADNNTWFAARNGEAWGAPQFAGKTINGVASETFFSESDTNIAVFTRFGEGDGRARPAYLMTAQRSASTFSAVVQIPVLPARVRISNPSIAPSGKLIVAAGRAGGSTDLYYAQKDSNGTWSAFQRLKAPINTTEHAEYAPYISNDGHTLYFSSDRPSVAGGEGDIYSVAMPEALAVIAQPETEYGPARGTLVIVGGGGTAGTQIMDRFIALGGGANEGKFVIVPTAGGNRDGDGNVRIFNEDDVLAGWRARGLKNVVMLHTHDPAVADTDAFAAPLKDATAVWFNGGRQWNIVDSYMGTQTYDGFHSVLARGGVVGGSSAGATIQGAYLVRGDTSGPNVIMTEEVNHQKGFDFLRRSAIDQHINTRVRWDDIIPVIKAKPELLGIGLSERTAIIVTGDRFEVMGAWKVAVHDNTRQYQPWQKPYFVLSAGDIFNMKTRTVEKLGIGRLP